MVPCSRCASWSDFTAIFLVGFHAFCELLHSFLLHWNELMRRVILIPLGVINSLCTGAHFPREFRVFWPGPRVPIYLLLAISLLLPSLFLPISVTSLGK